MDKPLIISIPGDKNMPVINDIQDYNQICHICQSNLNYLQKLNSKPIDFNKNYFEFYFFEKINNIYICRKCNMKFHDECIQEWFKIRFECPNCYRINIKERRNIRRKRNILCISLMCSMFSLILIYCIIINFYNNKKYF